MIAIGIVLEVYPVGVPAGVTLENGGPARLIHTGDARRTRQGRGEALRRCRGQIDD